VGPLEIESRYWPASIGQRGLPASCAHLPERCKALVTVSGYLIGSQEAGRLPLQPTAELQWCYQYYFATDRGRAGYEKCTRDFAKLIWRTASPNWDVDDATFDRSAASFVRECMSSESSLDPIPYRAVQPGILPGSTARLTRDTVNTNIKPTCTAGSPNQGASDSIETKKRV
jgi:hypothetical protein